MVAALMPGDLSLPVMLATGILPGFGARRAPGPAWHPSSLFEGVIGGFWFDFTDTDKLRQTSVGVPPVATASDPVGLAFDQSRWAGKTYSQVLAEQPELLNNPGGPFVNTSGWAAGGGGSLSVVEGNLKGTAAGTDGAWFQQSFLATAGKTYLFTFNAVSDGTSQSVAMFIGTSGGSSDRLNSGASGGYQFGARSVIWTAPATETVALWFYAGAGMPANNYILLSKISIKEIPGNHATQPSSSLRPTYQVTHVRGDGSDDRLITSQNPTLAGTLIYAGTFEAASDVAIGVTGASGFDRCMLRTSADGYLQAAIGDQASAIIGAMDIRGVDGVYAVRWGGNGEAVKLTRGVSVEYAGVQEGSVTTAFPFLLGVVNAGGSATGFLDGKMRHCLFVPRFITDDELSQAVKYFS